MADPRLAKLADVLVNYSARVRKGDLVKITGAAVCEPLLAEVFRATLRAGGNPYIHLQSEQSAEDFVRLASPDQLDFENPVAQHEIETIDCLISTWGGSNTKALSNADPAKQARASKARRKWFTTFMTRTAIPVGKKGNMRWIGTMFPNEASAQDADMSLREYEDFVYDAGLLNLKDPVAAWKAVSAKQEKVVKYLNKVSEVRFKTPQGTDLTVGVKGRDWINCDGHVNFPDGEVFTGPIDRHFTADAIGDCAATGAAAARIRATDCVRREAKRDTGSSSGGLRPENIRARLGGGQGARARP